MVQVLTYANPFKLKDNIELWNIMCSKPHYCASDTLVQGMEKEYGRNSFGILRSVNDLTNSILGAFTNNAQNDMQLFLCVMDEIRKISNDNMRTSFKFNVSQVVSSIKTLLLLGCDTSKFFDNALSEEQKVLVDIYNKVSFEKCSKLLTRACNITKSEFIDKAKSTVISEVKFLCNKKPEYLKIIGDKFKLTDIHECLECIYLLISYLDEKMKTNNDDFIRISSISYDLKTLQHLKSVIEKMNDEYFDNIVIHGVHKITPQLMCLFKIMTRLNINIIFVINYANNLKSIYKTWDEVYSWTNCKFEYVSELNMSDGKQIAIEVANVLEGKNSKKEVTEKMIAYSNLTSFTDGEVRKKYKQAAKLAKLEENVLSKMDTQYYAVNGKDSNEILKNYFPEQFKHKPFLSYPIGQFVLGIYEMWDFENDMISINMAKLSECAVSGLYKNTVDLLYVINKVAIYFNDIETVADFEKRADTLKTSCGTVNTNSRYKDLNYLSVFSLSNEEINELVAYVRFVDKVSKKIFITDNSNIDYRAHFKNLLDVISEEISDLNVLSETERQLVTDILEKLTPDNDNTVEGNIKDVRDALAFYLTETSKGDTSNWIVRDFEQIDGAVLQRKGKNAARVYHFALVSNSNMTKQKSDVLSWPITEKMFNSYRKLESSMNIIATGIREHKNFLKFSLFYGLFFTKCRLEISYIEEENGVQQRPYYLLDVIGMKSIVAKPTGITISKAPANDVSNTKFISDKVNKNGLELYAVCPYKFFMSEVIKEPIMYYNEYQMKYYLTNFLYAYMMTETNALSGNIEKIVTNEVNNIQKMFPFWDEVIFSDIKNSVIMQVTRQVAHINDGGKIGNQDTYYRRKKNFLIASWKDEKTNEQLMNFDKPELKSMIMSYMDVNDLYPKRSERPCSKVCENCNYGSSCLLNYYYAYATGNGEEDE